VQGIQLSTLEATANWLSALYEVFNLLFGLDKFYSNIGLTSFCLWKTKVESFSSCYIFFIWVRSMHSDGLLWTSWCMFLALCKIYMYMCTFWQFDTLIASGRSLAFEVRIYAP
jgi:hypothetical protein